MRRSNVGTWVLASLLLLLLTAPLPLAAQRFDGAGPTATRLFALPEGLSVFEMEHRADEGDFVVRLLDGEGRVIDELAHGSGRFGGSKAIRIPRTGEYLLDVTASGEWSIRRRPADATADGAASPAFQRGREAGAEAAASVPTASWFARGVVGGLLAGPIGMGITTGMAGRSRVDAPDPSAPGTLDLSFDDGFRRGFEERAHARRKKSAFVGGMVGTGILAAALIVVLDVAGAGEGSGTTPPPPPGTGLARGPS